MQHDLALALGMTVGELKRRMTYGEFRRWQKYIEIYGPVNPIMRNDAAVARLAVAYTGGKMEAFMPWPKEPEREVTVDETMNVVMSAFNKNKGK